MRKTTLIERILGTTDVSYMIAIFVFAMIGVAISLLIHSTNRNPDSFTSPRKFSLSYLIKDNWKRILLNILLILVTIRFSEEIIGVQLNEFVALLIGVSFDKLSEYLQNKKVIIGKKDDK